MSQDKNNGTQLAVVVRNRKMVLPLAQTALFFAHEEDYACSNYLLNFRQRNTAKQSCVPNVLSGSTAVNKHQRAYEICK